MEPEARKPTSVVQINSLCWVCFPTDRINEGQRKNIIVDLKKLNNQNWKHKYLRYIKKSTEYVDGFKDLMTYLLKNEEIECTHEAFFK